MKVVKWTRFEGRINKLSDGMLRAHRVGLELSRIDEGERERETWPLRAYMLSRDRLVGSCIRRNDGITSTQQPLTTNEK